MLSNDRPVCVAPVPRERAERLARFTLSRGSMIALETDYQLHQFDGAWSIDPLGIEQDSSTTEHRCSIVPRIDACHGKFLAGFNNARAVVIEDAYALRSDPNRPGCAFADNRVVRWRSVQQTTPAAAQFLRAGAHGVPLCSYIVSCTPSELGLLDGAPLTSAAMARIASSTVALVLPLFDSDSSLVLCRVAPLFPESW